MPGRDYSREFLLCWTRLIMACSNAGHEVIMSQNYSSFVPFARAKCLGNDVMAGPVQKPFQGQLDYDVIVWLDSDIIFSPQMILDLVNSPHNVTSGLYIMEDNVHYATVKDWDTAFFKANGSFEFITPESVETYKKETEQKYMPVAYSGMGLMAIKKGVVEKLKYPYFYYDLQKIETGKEDVPFLVDMCSEDVAFCKHLQDAGETIMVNLDIRGGHQKRLVL